jgi:hypothetical protein
MPKTARLSGVIDVIELDSVDHEAMTGNEIKHALQLHLFGLLPLYTVSILDELGVSIAS